MAIRSPERRLAPAASAAAVRWFRRRRFGDKRTMETLVARLRAPSMWLFLAAVVAAVAFGITVWISIGLFVVALALNFWLGTVRTDPVTVRAPVKRCSPRRPARSSRCTTASATIAAATRRSGSCCCSSR